MNRPHPWEAQAQATDTSGDSALATALRSAVALGIAHVTLLDDGYTITTGELVLHQVTRTFSTHTPQALAQHLGLLAALIHDARRSEADPDARPH